MSAFRDQIATDNEALFLDSEEGFADAITQHPEGVVADAVELVGTFIEDEPHRRGGYGDSTLRHGTLWVKSDVVVSVKDAFLIAGEAWHVETYDQEAIGLRAVRLKRSVKRTTKTAQPDLR